ncbi:hypothetical protein AB4Y45_16300 [Paraburkholderia sp. EG287A]|uniref:hypothetical protein n=1 Tax=unclassified Paraburkholderia TaxID=2615204 RepID=UPI0034D16C03
MKHELDGLELSAFLIHVVIALVLLGFVVVRFRPEAREWLPSEAPTITIDALAGPFQSVATLVQPDEKPVPAFEPKALAEPHAAE